MEIASHIDLPDGVQDREGLRRKIGEFASNSSNDIVNLTALSLSVFGSETYLAIEALILSLLNESLIPSVLTIILKNFLIFALLILNSPSISISLLLQYSDKQVSLPKSEGLRIDLSEQHFCIYKTKEDAITYCIEQSFDKDILIVEDSKIWIICERISWAKELE
jgi:hypothetical protein